MVFRVDRTHGWVLKVCEIEGLGFRVHETQGLVVRRLKRKEASKG